ncbi:MAG TPA: hypothetical protein VIG90_06525 [Pedomonas sp.]|uniref:hypothetical protein n=1 Tax=Pedomonas sp. TaxID=2976421 RepID=UPI002F41A021
MTKVFWPAMPVTWLHVPYAENIGSMAGIAPSSTALRREGFGANSLSLTVVCNLCGD